MPITDTIKKARERRIPDERILEEIVKQNPKKGAGIEEAKKRGATATQILEEIIKQNTQKTQLAQTSEPTEEQKRLEQAKRRIEALKKTGAQNTQQEKKTATPITEIIKEQKPSTIALAKVPEVTSVKETGVKDLISRMKGGKTQEPQKKPAITPEPSPNLSTPFPLKPSGKEKLWVRLAVSSFIIVLVVGVATFWYWYFVIRVSPPGSPTPIPTGTTSPTPQITPSPGIEIPLSLILTELDKTIEINNSQELRPLLEQALQEWQNTEEFERLIIRNVRENKVFGVKDFLEALLVRAPQDLFPTIENDFTLFIYSQREGNRLGFVTKVVDPAGLANALRTEESNMMADFETFFALLGKEQGKPPLVPYFRDSSAIRTYRGPSFRFLTITSQDLGILYLASDDYLIFTSSLDNMEKTIERLRIAGPKRGLTLDLRKGDTGFEVELLQTWLKEEGSTIYPEALITGIFGSKTEAAVKRFQERYELDVLTPQGLSKGDGIVEQYTRWKLNELYAESGIIPPIPQITKELREGDSGNEVRLLQTWLAESSEVYPEGKITGWFGPLTYRAVKRFQEKYASEILVPQNLQQGTGVVDVLTRRKLNTLYGGQSQ